MTAEISRRRLLHLVASVAALPTQTARAEDYPTRPIRLVVPYPPGGVVDAVGWPWADRMKSLLGTVIVENIGGGGGELGAMTVARALPDGYTILLANSSIMVINPIAGTHVAYDPIGSFHNRPRRARNCNQSYSSGSDIEGVGRVREAQYG